VSGRLQACLTGVSQVDSNPAGVTIFKGINFNTNIMSKVCQLTGKRPITGNNVSHSKRRTKRRFLPNIQKKRYFIPETGEWVTLKLSAKAMRNINKLGVYAYIKKLERKGIETGVKL
jgi:large subunit ribosomal protein L28